MNDRLSKASFKQKLDPISKNIIRNSNRPELAFKEISACHVPNPVIGSLLRKIDIEEKKIFIESLLKHLTHETLESLLKHLTHKILSCLHVLISIDILKITPLTTTTTTIFHYNHHHHHHNHLDETIFFSSFNLHHIFLDKMIFFSHHHQYCLHCHYHLMIIFLHQTHQMFFPEPPKK